MRKNHIVSLDEDALNLARALGLVNLSEFVRDAVSYFISGTDRELSPSEIRELSKKFAHEKRAALMKQQKLTGQTEEERARIEAIQQKRRDAIDAATRQEVTRIGPDRFRRYLDDTTGDYQTIIDDVIAAISERSGQPAQLCDVVESFKRVRVDAHQ